MITDINVNISILWNSHKVATTSFNINVVLVKVVANR